MTSLDISEFHPDLQRHFEDGMLDHPLLRYPYPDPDHANKIYISKKCDIKIAVHKKDWDSFVFLHERPHRPTALRTLIRRHGVALDHLWPLIGDVWSDTEFPMHQADFWQKIWSSTCPHRKTVMGFEDRLNLNKLPKQITVWRGVNDFEAISGFSWSLERKIGVFFARRFSGEEREPILVQGIVKKRDVVAYFGGRNEAEIVTLPECVRVIDTQVLALPPEVAE
jgi:hypothetical protein